MRLVMNVYNYYFHRGDRDRDRLSWLIRSLLCSISISVFLYFSSRMPSNPELVINQSCTIDLENVQSINHSIIFFYFQRITITPPLSHMCTHTHSPPPPPPQVLSCVSPSLISRCPCLKLSPPSIFSPGTENRSNSLKINEPYLSKMFLGFLL